jgi:hypothetical protein
MRRMKRVLPAFVALLTASIGSLRPAAAQAPRGAESIEQPDMFVEMTPASERAIQNGLQYLARSQLPSGAWVYANVGPNVGVTSLALLALLGAGHVPEQGEYAEVIDRGVNWVLSNAQTSGLIHYQQGSSHGPMYEHAAATLMLSEIYGMSEDPRIPDKVHAAVRVIVNAQNPAGGWRYQPFSSDADISVTVMQILALRGAQQAGMVVPAETIERAIKYVKSCADRGGGFLYMPGSGQPGYARTGAGVCSLEVCGQLDADETHRGLDYLLANIGKDDKGGNLHYALYYAAQAVYQAKDFHRWQQWFPAIREQILSLQENHSFWSSEHGSPYGTSMMVLALSIPYRYLPIYQR